MEKIEQLLDYARQIQASDIHLTEHEGIAFRKNGMMISQSSEGVEVRTLILSMLDGEMKRKLEAKEDIDFCYISKKGQRQRVNVYTQYEGLCAAIRLLNDDMPSFKSLHMPQVVEQLANEPRGLILVTGPTGSGKSTTLAAIIDYINTTRKGHILTIEDPVEYRHKSKSSIVHQREVGKDIGSFAGAIRSAMRQDPDVILVGEMRDLETISTAITAAETGHLVLATLHTTGAANTINRIIDVFPPHGQGQIRTQLAATLKGVISQQLIPRADQDGRCAAFEILIATEAVSSMIREDKVHQIGSMLQTGVKEGMLSLNRSLVDLVQKGHISLDSAVKLSDNRDELFRLMQ